MKLYWRPQTRASRVEWVVTERFALHPLGRVPVLEDDTGVRRFESVALCNLAAFPALGEYRDRLLERPTARRLFAEAPPC